MIPNKNLFGNRIRYIRLEKELTIQDVADAIGVIKGTLSNIEKGTRAPSFDMAITLATYFDVSLDYLVGRSDNPVAHRIKKDTPN